MQEDTYLLKKSCTVALHILAPYECVSVGLGFNLCTVNIFNVKTYESLGCKDEYYLCEYPVYFILHAVTETVYSPVIRLLITGKPDEMDVTG